ncbi:hypothetical protein SUGI_0902000 [Cryptomeria japonica]|nr:hypothetical protein SUGI_0902000 [Cryptomeria japonica]
MSIQDYQASSWWEFRVLIRLGIPMAYPSSNDYPHEYQLTKWENPHLDLVKINVEKEVTKDNSGNASMEGVCDHNGKVKSWFAVVLVVVLLLLLRLWPFVRLF